MLTGAELKDAQRDLIVHAARDLILGAEMLGFIITIEQKPLQPLAMGNYQTTLDVRPMREKS
jgi:hypothetical protein